MNFRIFCLTLLTLVYCTTQSSFSMDEGREFQKIGIHVLSLIADISSSDSPEAPPCFTFKSYLDAHRAFSCYTPEDRGFEVFSKTSYYNRMEAFCKKTTHQDPQEQEFFRDVFRAIQNFPFCITIGPLQNSTGDSVYINHHFLRNLPNAAPLETPDTQSTLASPASIRAPLQAPAALASAADTQINLGPPASIRAPLQAPAPPVDKARDQAAHKHQQQEDQRFRGFFPEGEDPTMWSVSNYCTILYGLCYIKHIAHMTLSEEALLEGPHALPEGASSETAPLVVFSPILQANTDKENHLLCGYNATKAFLIEIDRITSKLRGLQRDGAIIGSQSFARTSFLKQCMLFHFSIGYSTCFNSLGKRNLHGILGDLPAFQTALRYTQSLKPPSAKRPEEFTLQVGEEARRSLNVALLSTIIKSYIAVYGGLDDSFEEEKTSIRELILSLNRDLKKYDLGLARTYTVLLSSLPAPRPALRDSLDSPYARSLCFATSMQNLLDMPQDSSSNTALVKVMNALPKIIHSSRPASSRDIEAAELLIQSFENALEEDFSTALPPELRTASSSEEEKKKLRHLYTTFSETGKFREFTPHVFLQLAHFFAQRQNFEKALFFTTAARTSTIQTKIDYKTSLYFYTFEAFLKASQGDFSNMHTLFSIYQEAKRADTELKRTKRQSFIHKIKAHLAAAATTPAPPKMPVPLSPVRENSNAPTKEDDSQGAETPKPFSQPSEKLASKEEKAAKLARHLARKQAAMASSNKAECAAAESASSEEEDVASPLLSGAEEDFPPFVGHILTHAQERVDAQICEGTFSFRREDLVTYFQEFGCDVGPGKGSHLTAELPTFVALPNKEFLTTLFPEDVTIGGAYPFGRWKGTDTPRYIKKQLPEVRRSLWHYFNALHQAKLQQESATKLSSNTTNES